MATTLETITIVCPLCHITNSIDKHLQGTDILCSGCNDDLNDPFPSEVNDYEAKIHIQNDDIPILLDFYSTTCGPCMAMYEAYENAALEFSMQVRFLKVNADEYQKVAKEYGVNALPTIIALHKGEEVNRISKQLSQVELGLWAKSLLS